MIFRCCCFPFFSESLCDKNSTSVASGPASLAFSAYPSTLDLNVRLVVGIVVRVAGCATGRETKQAATYIVCTLAGPLKDVIRHHDLGRQELRAVEIMILGFNTDSTLGPVSVHPARVRVDFFRDARSRELESKRARPAILPVSNSRPAPPSPPSSPPWGGPR